MDPNHQAMAEKISEHLWDESIGTFSNLFSDNVEPGSAMGEKSQVLIPKKTLKFLKNLKYDKWYMIAFKAMCLFKTSRLNKFT